MWVCETQNPFFRSESWFNMFDLDLMFATDLSLDLRDESVSYGLKQQTTLTDSMVANAVDSFVSQ